MKMRKPLPKAKPSAPFQIPNEYLPLVRYEIGDHADEGL